MTSLVYFSGSLLDSGITTFELRNPNPSPIDLNVIWSSFRLKVLKTWRQVQTYPFSGRKSAIMEEAPLKNKQRSWVHVVGNSSLHPSVSRCQLIRFCSSDSAVTPWVHTDVYVWLICIRYSACSFLWTYTPPHFQEASYQDVKSTFAEKRYISLIYLPPASPRTMGSIANRKNTSCILLFFFFTYPISL